MDEWHAYLSDVRPESLGDESTVDKLGEPLTSSKTEAEEDLGEKKRGPTHPELMDQAAIVCPADIFLFCHHLHCSRAFHRTNQIIDQPISSGLCGQPTADSPPNGHAGPS